MAESRLGGGPSADHSGAEGESQPGAGGPALGGRWSAGRDSRKGVRPSLGGQKSQVYPVNAARERSRVRNLRQAFHSLQAALPSTLDQGDTPAERAPLCRPGGFLHPVKKWPMRSLLYCGSVGELLSGAPANQKASCGDDDANPLAPGAHNALRRWVTMASEAGAERVRGRRDPPDGRRRTAAAAEERMEKQNVPIIILSRDRSR
ncbi:hypothetical protein SKAU_G00182070 [Synaphobranchus kaupii]|uniref:BHLH domain-containing protein n=1 Tax=Synaphobranchus kaupii TaxID=118154 RepID=A0A9Q1FBR2_SYNKA|nr:hypothetical protein SKAU_G00182070 [Synaphobranchus kaupii]